MTSEEYQEELRKLQEDCNRSSNARLERVNDIVSKMENQSVTITELTMKVISMFERNQMWEKELTDSMMVFLTEMRTAYDYHLKSLERDRDRAVEALKVEQEHVSRLIDRLHAASASSITIKDVGNPETTISR